MRTALRAGVVVCCSLLAGSVSGEDADAEFFTSQVEPILVSRCYECHSHEKQIKGGLALDSRAGLETGGDGGTAVVPGDPDTSRLILAVRYADPELQMPPKQKLSDAEIAVLEEWVKRGAHDPRVSTVASPEKMEWESIYQDRLTWWSLQPVTNPSPPATQHTAWTRNEIDAFVLAALEAKGLSPAPEAERRTIARRLSFALTGLPPTPEVVERFVADATPTAYETYVQSLIDNPHFGEKWARHWMDVVHYSDTHGYEWDTPAKNAWMYRDYLIRAFNNDVSFQRLILEQLAGDLIEPRVDATGLNEALIGPTAMRLGERRHGDNADAEGISQEMVTNVIDTVSKGFLATTVACAQCHDHKLDAVEQRDFFGIAGILMSSRWIVRTADTTDPNEAVIAELKGIKGEMRTAVANRWRAAADVVKAQIAATPQEEIEEKKDAKAKPTPPKEPGMPESMLTIWRHVLRASAAGTPIDAAWTGLGSTIAAESAKRAEANRANLQLLADFTNGDVPTGWKIDGFGMKHGFVRDGELVVADEGDAAIAQLLPAGRWSNVWSARLAGALRSPLFAQDPAPTISVGYGAGKHAAQSLIVDNAFHSERMKFLNQPMTGRLTFATGKLPALAGGADTRQRRVYLELVTKSLNNYFPPRTMYGGVTEDAEKDPRSWFGITRVYQHEDGKAPADELARLLPLFAVGNAPTTTDEVAARLASLVMAAVEHWHLGTCDAEDVRVINEAIAAKWLPNDSASDAAIAGLVQRYRDTEQRLVPDRVIGSTDDWSEGRNERIGIRGSYTDLGDEVPRGNIRFLGGPGARAFEKSSGRLEWAQGIASDRNPLTARVYVNRVWYQLFGTGIVRTVDDFGHLGEAPSHPELLDYLAKRFMDEGWSTKKLITMIVTSATWRQASLASESAVAVDPENRLLHHFPLRRLEAESIRDSILAVAGRLDATLYGPPIEPFRTASDAAKRLAVGPLDGNGRRSIYIEMTLMEPPKFLALFNQPIPKLTTGRRDTTNVPDQALALLNDPFVVAMAKHWADRVVQDQSANAEQRIESMFVLAYGRPPKLEETQRLVAFAMHCAELRGADVNQLMTCQPAWQDVAHAMFNLKEFIYVE